VALAQLGEILDLYQRAMASCRRIFGLMEVEPAILPGGATLPEPARGEVRFDDVTFSYHRPPPGDDGTPTPTTGDADRAVLRGFSLHVPAGETHAIVGSTGSGKSTVLKLLLRLYEPDRGVVTLDGVPIEQLTFSSLRGATGFVPQDVFLFHGTVRDNIAYGRPDATDEQIRRAAELAEADTFIRAMPHGYASMVGERGQKLSGGQRQRITIARALLRDPAVLLLDEATSAIDNETEAAIQESLAHVSIDRTTIVIAHRLSTIRHAHRIHVMEAGRIVEAGWNRSQRCGGSRPKTAVWALAGRQCERRWARHASGDVDAPRAALAGSRAPDPSAETVPRHKGWAPAGNDPSPASSCHTHSTGPAPSSRCASSAVRTSPGLGGSVASANSR
jgi:ATP-binding cassette subfamily B protein